MVSRIKNISIPEANFSKVLVLRRWAGGGGILFVNWTEVCFPVHILWVRPLVWYGMVRYGMVRYGEVWYGEVWYGMVW